MKFCKNNTRNFPKKELLAKYESNLRKEHDAFLVARMSEVLKNSKPEAVEFVIDSATKEHYCKNMNLYNSFSELKNSESHN